MPEKPLRSKLEPHMEVIRQLRRKGRTYQEIAGFFAEHLGIPVAASTIHAFIKVRDRQRQQGRPPSRNDRRTTLDQQKSVADAA